MEVPLTPPDTPRQDPLSELGARELEVLTQLARGRRNREVAQQLHISEPTVKFHLVRRLARQRRAWVWCLPWLIFLS
ncbi:LuxR C-terminal-related transcriptional regulator [Streptomyces flaveolus]|uniref:response regulator transcription factor n=1 Tax=Streptomyces flaveolus TaxID=67297 RepID=UPI00344094CC